MISLEILRKSLRIHLQDSLYLEERDLSGDLEEVLGFICNTVLTCKNDLSGDLEEVFEDAFSRQSVPGRK